MSLRGVEGRMLRDGPCDGPTGAHVASQEGARTSECLEKMGRGGEAPQGPGGRKGMVPSSCQPSYATDLGFLSS